MTTIAKRTATLGGNILEGGSANKYVASVMGASKNYGRFATHKFVPRVKKVERNFLGEYEKGRFLRHVRYRGLHVYARIHMALNLNEYRYRYPNRCGVKAALFPSF